MSNFECPICGLSIEESEDSIAYCHFIFDPKDPLYSFSNSSFHRVCFDSWKWKSKYISKFEQYLNESFTDLETRAFEALKDLEIPEELM
ncbi:MAG: hypothetical protein SFU98_18680 [Leptospiraceae bacterium]|nr:hypothetical protein [Leptospiraceae bacterium]